MRAGRGDGWQRRSQRLLVPEAPRRGASCGVLLVGGAVALALGVYGKAHDPTAEQPYSLFFTATIQLKVWFATAAVVLAVVQVLLGMRLFDKIHVPAPRTGVAR